MAATITQQGAVATLSSICRMSFFAFNNNQMGIMSISLRIFSVSGFSITYGQICEAIENAVHNQWLNLMAGDTETVGAKLAPQNLTPNPLSGIVIDADVGANAGFTLPGQVSGIISLRTNIAGRAFRGRMYAPFPYSGSVDTNNTPTGVYVGRLTTFVQAILAISSLTVGADSVAWQYVIYHRATKTYDPINEAAGKKLYATQRRRGDYGRTNIEVIT